MDFDNMKKDKDFQKWCFDTDIVGNKNWFNLENGSGDEVYIAYEAWVAGQQSKQAEVDELRKRIDDIVKWVERNKASIPLSEWHGYTTEEYVDADDLLDILKGDQS